MESLLCRMLLATGGEPVMSFFDDIVGNAMLDLLLLIAGKKLGDDFVTFIALNEEAEDIPCFPDGIEEEQLDVQQESTALSPCRSIISADVDKLRPMVPAAVVLLLVGVRVLLELLPKSIIIADTGPLLMVAEDFRRETFVRLLISECAGVPLGKSNRIGIEREGGDAMGDCMGMKSDTSTAAADLDFAHGVLAAEGLLAVEGVRTTAPMTRRLVFTGCCSMCEADGCLDTSGARMRLRNEGISVGSSIDSLCVA